MTNKALWQGLIDVSVGIIPFHSRSQSPGWQHFLHKQTLQCPLGRLSWLGTSEPPLQCDTPQTRSSEKLRAQEGIEVLPLRKLATRLSEVSWPGALSNPMFVSKIPTRPFSTPFPQQVGVFCLVKDTVTCFHHLSLLLWPESLSALYGYTFLSLQRSFSSRLSCCPQIQICIRQRNGGLWTELCRWGQSVLHQTLCTEWRQAAEQASTSLVSILDSSAAFSSAFLKKIWGCAWVMDGHTGTSELKRRTLRPDTLGKPWFILHLGFPGRASLLSFISNKKWQPGASVVPVLSACTESRHY